MTDTDRVIEGGYCVGCGVCSHVAPELYSVNSDGIGRRQAIRISSEAESDGAALADRVCPFSSSGPNEDEIAKAHFGRPGATLNSSVGYHLAVYAGHVSEGSFRENGSSGGFASWISSELLRLGMVDAVLSVRSNSDSFGFGYQIATSQSDVDACAKTRYYPVSIETALLQASKYERIAVVGLPCFIKAIRRLGYVDPTFKVKLRYAVSLVCGHLKTDGFGKLLAWQLGFEPDKISTVDFRLKLENRPASRYGVRVVGTNGRVLDSPMSELVGSNWGHGILKYAACDYCDDVFGETADVSVGDAWLQRFENDSRGTNVVVVRNQEIQQLVASAQAEGRLSLADLSVGDAEASQAGGLRHRRDGLKFRLLLKYRAGQWVPTKRVDPGDPFVKEQSRAVQRQRLKVQDRSNSLFQQALERSDLKFFLDGIAPDLALLDKLQREGIRARAVSLSRRIVRRLRRAFAEVGKS